jgi:hypothetical protein
VVASKATRTDNKEVQKADRADSAQKVKVRVPREASNKPAARMINRKNPRAARVPVVATRAIVRVAVRISI